MRAQAEACGYQAIKVGKIKPRRLRHPGFVVYD